MVALVSGCAAEEFGDPCTATDDCAGDAVCPTEGYLQGYCTSTCAPDSTTCGDVYGSEYRCVSQPEFGEASICAKTCSVDLDCPGSLRCSFITGAVGFCSSVQL